MNKLEEFFSNQFKSSKKLFSDLEPLSSANVRDKYAGRERSNRNATGISTSDEGSGISHHRHWQNALKKISGMKIYTLPFKLPEVGSVLGGVLELRGRHISLACFHGINFKVNFQDANTSSRQPTTTQNRNQPTRKDQTF